MRETYALALRHAQTADLLIPDTAAVLNTLGRRATGGPVSNRHRREGPWLSAQLVIAFVVRDAASVRLASNDNVETTAELTVAAQHVARAPEAAAGIGR